MAELWGEPLGKRIGRGTKYELSRGVRSQGPCDGGDVGLSKIKREQY